MSTPPGKGSLSFRMHDATAGRAASAEERAEEPAMADKPEFVDLIRDATRQRRRTPPAKIIAKPEAPKDERRLSSWPP